MSLLQLMSASYAKQHCFVYRGSPPNFPMQVRALQLFSLFLSLSLLVHGPVDSGKWFNSHANPAKTPVIHAANYTNVGTLTC